MPDTTYHITRDVARIVGYTPNSIIAMIAAGRVPAPARDRYGRYLWTDADIEAVRAALACDRRRREHRHLRPAAQGCQEGAAHAS